MASYGIDPAFPPPGGGNKQGLTIRDYFAAAALNGLATALADDLEFDEKRAVIANQAYGLADAMLKRRDAP